MGCDFFQGYPDPYTTPGLARDALFLGQAVEQFLEAAGAMPDQFVWGAPDWVVASLRALLGAVRSAVPAPTL